MGIEPNHKPDLDDSWTVGSLGNTIHSFHPTASPRLVASIVAPFLALTCWLVAIGLADHDSGILTILLGLMIIFMLFVFICIVFSAMTLHVHICDRGFYCDQLQDRRIFPWDRVREVREDVIHRYKTYSHQKAGIKSGTTVGFEVVKVSGLSFAFVYNPERWTESLEREARKAAALYGFTWTVREHHCVDD